MGCSASASVSAAQAPIKPSVKVQEFCASPVEQLETQVAEKAVAVVAEEETVQQLSIGDEVVVVAGRYRGLSGVVVGERSGLGKRFFTVKGIYGIDLNLHWFDGQQLQLAASAAKKAKAEEDTVSVSTDAGSHVQTETTEELSYDF